MATRVVARGDRQVETRVVARTGERAAIGSLCGSHAGHPTGEIPGRTGDAVPRLQADGPSRRGWIFQSSTGVRIAVMAAAGHRGARTADRLREPGELDAGASERAGERDRGAAGSGSEEGAAGPATADREPADRAGGGVNGRGPGARFESLPGALPEW